MALNYVDLRDKVIIPVLQKINLYSDSAVNLLLGTCAVESDFGTYIVQKGGPALGIYQMEKNTFDDIVGNFLNHRAELKNKIITALNFALFPDSSELVSNLSFSTVMTRIHYLRSPEKLPESHDIAALARYWKRYYNTPFGKGEVMDFISKYNKYIINREKR